MTCPSCIQYHHEYLSVEIILENHLPLERPSTVGQINDVFHKAAFAPPLVPVDTVDSMGIQCRHWNSMDILFIRLLWIQPFDHFQPRRCLTQGLCLCNLMLTILSDRVTDVTDCPPTSACKGTLYLHLCHLCRRAELFAAWPVALPVCHQV